jgi:hypothetical protein
MNFINIKKLFLLLSFISFTAIAATAQVVVVRGKVVDKSGKGMQGVSVSVLDADGRIVSGASTDIEGNFVIKNVNTKNRISVSNIGYKSITQSIGTRTSFNFTLEDAQSDLGEVVVVARPQSNNGMVNISERNLTTAAQKINAKELEEMQASSIDQALQGS